MHCPTPLSVVRQCKLVSVLRLRKERSSPPHGLCGFGKTLRGFFYKQCLLSDKKESIIILSLRFANARRRIKKDNRLTHWTSSATHERGCLTSGQLDDVTDDVERVVMESGRRDTRLVSRHDVGFDVVVKKGKEDKWEFQ